MHIQTVALALLTLSICCAATNARAGNGEGIYFGEQAVLTGGAVRAIVDDGSAAIYNPAALGRIDRSILNVSLSAFQYRTQTQRDAFIVDLSGDGGDRYSIRGSELTPIPTSIAFSRPLTERWVVGLGVFTNSFDNTNLSLDGATESDSISVDTDIDLQVKENVFRAAAGIGRQVNPKVAFGMSVAARIAINSITSSVSLDIDAPNVESSQLLFSRSRSTVAGLGLILGTTVNMSDRWTFGGVLELPTFRVFERGQTRNSTLSGTIVDGQVQDFESTESQTRNESDSGLLLEFVRLHLSFAYAANQWTLTVESDFSLEPDVNDELRAVPNVRVGLQYATPSNIVLGFGLFTDSASSEEQTEAELGEYQFVGVSSAVRFQNVRIVEDAGAERDLIFSTTFGLRYAYGSSDFRPTILADNESDGPPSLSRQFAHELTLYVASKFQF